MKYKTVVGDTFDSIAYKFTTNKNFIKNLIERNPRHITTVIFSDNIELDVPEITEEIKESSNRPLWR